MSRNNVTVTEEQEGDVSADLTSSKLPELSDADLGYLRTMGGDWNEVKKESLPRTIKTARTLARTSETSFQEMVKAMGSGCLIVAMRFCDNGKQSAILSAEIYEELKERPDVSKLLRGAAKYADTTYERFKGIETLKDKSIIPYWCKEWHRIFKKASTETVK